MAATATNTLSLLEQANRIDPEGRLAVIAEVLNEVNEIMADAPWTEANNQWAHVTTRRLSLPSGSWRRLNEGVAVEVSKTIKVSETIGMLESYSVPDKALIDNMPNPGAARDDEARSFIEGMGQTLVATMIYGNAAINTEQFNGLSVRLDALAQTNVIGAGGSSSDLTSIWVVQWGVDKVHMVYPRGHRNLGVNHENRGQQTWLDSNSNPYEAYVDHFIVYCGMVVRDDRSIGRICNIETTGTTNIFDEDDLITLLNKMPNRGKGCAIYVNDTIMTQAQIALKDKANMYFSEGSRDALSGPRDIYFAGIPFRQVDQILNTESAIA